MGMVSKLGSLASLMNSARAIINFALLNHVRFSEYARCLFSHL